MTQEELGALVGAEGATISRIEGGSQIKTLERFVRIADALGVSLLDLFVLSEEDEKRKRLVSLALNIPQTDHGTAIRLLEALQTSSEMQD